ncbi:MAG TPA: cytochrome c biogenesis protein ResB [Pyrinomonadaceae bacterium]|jgi:cytochrome c biogenesis protein
MSTAEETFKEKAGEFSKTKTLPVVDRVLNFLSSVRFGVVLLVILVLLAFLGMIIVQQNVNGFETYYLSLTPAEKIVYGRLGLFDIYHSWYFYLSLLVLSLNIIFASIDRFPSAWTFISRPKLDASRRWLLGQKQNAVINIQGENEQIVAEKIKDVFKHQGFRTTITQKKGKFYVFGEIGRWNRLGAYIVHVFLLTLFLGHFVALTSGFDADVRFMPGMTTSEIQLIEFNLDKQERFNVALPFTITCTDIQQKLINPEAGIDIGNTIDWRTQIKIDDPAYGQTVADISLNRPFTYRGYRFFQASAITQGSARTMTLELTPQNGGDVVKIDLAREGSAALPDGTKIDYEAFFPDFTFVNGQPDTRSAEYNNPAVVLNVTPPGGEKNRVFAFAQKLADNIPVGAPKVGYKWRLASFEKAPLAHVLSIKYDPFNAAFVAWYIGGFGLIGALIFVFFISHKRVWALIDKHNENDFEVALGGETNRNQMGFEDKFKKLTSELESVS